MSLCLQNLLGRRIWSARALLSVFLLLFATHSTTAQDLRVAAAADLQFAMKDLASQYESKTKQSVSVSYGSSGNFFTQLENGAPFDLFFSADSYYPQKLVGAGLADSHTFYSYALGQLALWAPAESHLDLANKGFSVLLDPQVRKIAIANPEHAPYGKAAVVALKKAGIYERVTAKLVFGENISQAAQFVQSGNAQVGILAFSLAISPVMQSGDRWIVPTELSPPLEQAVVLLTSSKNKAAAMSFLEFVKGTEGKEILARYGFTTAKNPSSRAKP